MICHSGGGSSGRLILSSDARAAVHSLFVPCSCAKLNSTQTFVQQVSRIERHISISSTDKVNYADIYVCLDTYVRTYVRACVRACVRVRERERGKERMISV